MLYYNWINLYYSVHIKQTITLQPHIKTLNIQNNIEKYTLIIWMISLSDIMYYKNIPFIMG